MRNESYDQQYHNPFHTFALSVTVAYASGNNLRLHIVYVYELAYINQVHHLQFVHVLYLRTIYTNVILHEVDLKGIVFHLVKDKKVMITLIKNKRSKLLNWSMSL